MQEHILNGWPSFYIILISLCTHVMINSLVFWIHSRSDTLNIVTLCAYAQQGYAFGRIGLCTYVYVYIFVDKKPGCLVPYRSKNFR